MKTCVDLRSGTALTLVAVLILGAPGSARTQEKSTAEGQLRQELDLVKEQLRRVEQMMKGQEELIRKLSGEKPPPAAVAAPSAPPKAPQAAAAAPPVTPPAPTSAESEAFRSGIVQDVLQAIQPQLTASNKTFASQFNPAIGVIVDSAFSHTRQNKWNFEFRSAELGFSASVDPFARAYAIINGTPDGLEVEEAAIVTRPCPTT